VATRGGSVIFVIFMRPEKVETIGLQRCRTSRQSCNNFNCEDHEVYTEHGPKDASVACVPGMRVDRLITGAFVSGGDA